MRNVTIVHGPESYMPIYAYGSPGVPFLGNDMNQVLVQPKDNNMDAKIFAPGVPSILGGPLKQQARSYPVDIYPMDIAAPAIDAVGCK